MSKMPYYDFLFKILLLGEPSAAKTNFLKRGFSGIFSEDYQMTIGVNFHVKTIEYREQRIKLQLWEMGTRERFQFLIPMYCRGARGAIILYDITDSHTFNKLPEWIQIIRYSAGDIPIILIGNNLDLDHLREVSVEDGLEFVEDYNLAAFREVSSTTGQNFTVIFEKLTELLIDYHPSYPPYIAKTIPKIRQPEFRINKFLSLRLENSITNIYVEGTLFNQCKYLLLNIPRDNVRDFDEIESIDEAAEKLDSSMETAGRYKLGIPPETEFWGHCSNLQAWYKNNYDTRILHRNLAFPLLKALVKAGDALAKKVLKEEIGLRLESGYPSVVLYLINEGYLNYLSQEELDTVLENAKFLKSLSRWFHNSEGIPKWFSKRIRAKLKRLENI